MNTETRNFSLKVLFIDKMYPKAQSIKYTTAGHVNPEKPILEKNGDRVPPTCAMVLPLLSTVYKYEEKINLTLSCAIVRIRTIGRGLQKNSQRTFA